MQVTVWFDPGCPWCWNTSRWIVDVAGQRDLEVTWRSFSLAIKKDGNENVPERHRKAGERNRRLLRVVEAARRAGHEDRIGDLYTELGRHIHHDHDADVDPVTVLEAVGIDTGLAAAADDQSLDEIIQASMDDALALAGDDTGVPIVAFGNGRGRTGFFGPILTEVPTGEAATRLFDALVTVAAIPGFRELKRARDGHPVAPSRP